MLFVRSIREARFMAGEDALNPRAAAAANLFRAAHSAASKPDHLRTGWYSGRLGPSLSAPEDVFADWQESLGCVLFRSDVLNAFGSLRAYGKGPFQRRWMRHLTLRDRTVMRCPALENVLRMYTDAGMFGPDTCRRIAQEMAAEIEGHAKAAAEIVPALALPELPVSLHPEAWRSYYFSLQLVFEDAAAHDGFAAWEFAEREVPS